MRLLAVMLIFAAIMPVSHAALTDWTIDIQLNSDKTTTWDVALLYNETISQNDYYIFGSISEYQVLADDKPAQCSISEDLGTSIVCSNLAAKKITYSMKTRPMVTEVLQNFRLFTYKFTATQITDRFTITIKLPLGDVLAESARLSGAGLKPFEPGFGRQGSDGRRIFVVWDIDKPKLGETINTAVVYEQLESPLQIGVFAGIMIALIVIFFVAVNFFRRTIKDILPILTEGERKVMEILLREKKDVDQRQVVRETDFSKAKVSRVIANLVNRGLIEKISRGRKNIIRLKRHFKPEKPQSGESKI